MKKILSFLIIFMSFAGCIKKDEKFSFDQFYPVGEREYTGGFEGSNYQILTEKLGSDYIKQTIITTATAVTRIYKVEEEEVKLVFTGEEVTNYKEGEQNIEEIVIKAPLSKGYRWVSNEKEFEILEFNGKELVISKKFPDGELITTYEMGVGIVQEIYKGEDFENISKIVKE